MKNMDNFWTLITGGGISAAAFLVGGIDQLFLAFVIFIICDLITGFLKAYTKKTVRSREMYHGLARKTGYMVFVVLAVQLDAISGSGGTLMRDTCLLFVIGIEGISILENLSEMGLPVPKFIKSTLERLRDENSDTK